MKELKVLLADVKDEFVKTLAERIEMRDLKSEIAFDGESALEIMDADLPNAAGLFVWGPELLCVEKRIDEADHFIQNHFAGLDVGNMPACGQQLCFHRTGNPCGNTPELGRRTVRVVFPLKRQQRACDFGKIGFDVPVEKIRRQPAVGPASKNVFRVFAVVTGQPGFQVAGLIGFDRIANAGEGHHFDKNMSRLGDDPAYPTAVARRGNQANGAAVAVPDQNSMLKIAVFQQAGQENLGFFAKIIKGPGAAVGIRSAVSLAIIHKPGTPGGRTNGLWKIPPEFDTPQSFMQKYQRRFFK